MLHLLARALRRLRAACHAACGWLAFRCGRTARARRHFEQVLDLGGDEFTAYVQLGRIALGEGDYAGYRREMNNARSCDPQRFARMRPELAGQEPRTPGNPEQEAGERATWRSVRPGGQGFVRRAAVRSAELPTDCGEASRPAEPYEPQLEPFELSASGSVAREGKELPRCDDFSSNSERARFRELPPIQPGEIADADVDELSRRLLG